MDMIKFTPQDIGGRKIKTVNARELHTFLGNRTNFRDWIKKRITDFGFTEGADFVRIEVQAGIRMSENGGEIGGIGDAQKTAALESMGYETSGQQGRVEYAITIDMAKELSMVERNERGKQARQYFIECERRAKDPLAALNDPATLRHTLLTYSERVIALESQVEEMAPKAEFHDAVCEAINGQTVQEVAKVLGTGQNRLFRALRKSGLLMTNNQPYQEYIDRGYFRMVERQYKDPRGEGHIYAKTLVTGKGLAFIQKNVNLGKAN